MFRNEKGSVMSVVVVIIAILSFSITSATAYTYSVVSRTQTQVETQSSDRLARTLINQSISEWRDFIRDINPATFSELHGYQETQDFIDYLSNTYSVTLTIQQDLTDIGEGRIYRFLYTRPNGSTVFRDLHVTLDSVDGDPTEQIEIDEEIDNQIEKILATMSEEDGDSFICTEEDDEEDECLLEFSQALSPTGNTGNMEGDIYYDGDLNFSFAAVTGEFKMNGNSLLVNGNLDLSNISKLSGPGMIFVTGNLTITQPNHGFEINDVIIMVGGYTRIHFTHNNEGQHRQLIGNNYAIISYNTSNYLGYGPDYEYDRSVAYLNSTYYIHTNSEPNFFFIGDRPFESLFDVFNQFQITVEQSGDSFEFDESAFGEFD